MIGRFVGKYDFLSNFYPCKIVYGDHEFNNSEAAFQAQKDLTRVEEFKTIDGLTAKRLGKKVNLRSDWEEIKLNLMEDVIKAKFIQNPELAEKLLATGDEEIVEGNYWHDYYWGVCGGKGQNHLGKIIMNVREYLKTLQK